MTAQQSDPADQARGIDHSTGRAPWWWDALIVLRAMALVVVFVNWLGPIGLLPAFVLVAMSGYWMAGIEQRWERRGDD